MIGWLWDYLWRPLPTHTCRPCRGAGVIIHTHGAYACAACHGTGLARVHDEDSR
jgi:DnaJ-class molecular chaperone